jgi:hypothetical protein
MQLTRRDFISMALAGGTAMVLPSSSAFATPTPITSLPVTIGTPGEYILTDDITVNMIDGAAILVTASNVSIDLNGKRIKNTFSDTACLAATAIRATANSLTVFNGTVEGFYIGIYTQNVFNGPFRGHYISMVEADACSATGFMVHGSGCVIRGCSVVNHGRSSRVFRAPSCEYSIAMVVNHGIGTMIIDSSVDSNGYDTNDHSIGILAGRDARDTIFINNQVLNAKFGFLIGHLTRCEMRDNHTISTAFPYYGNYIDLGSNTSA